MARKLATPPANPATSSLATGVKPCVGVLFVHGAGDHGVGATLIEFGEPIVGWLDGWLSRGQQAGTSAGDKARAGAAQILVREADPSAPAHSAVNLQPEGDDRDHVWLLAEARWDEAFTPPAFKQVLLWAVSVVPWTVLTQFIGPLIDQSRLLRPDLFEIARFFWNILVSTLLALVVAVVLQIVALAILLLSIIPLDPVRELVGKLQRFASTSVGDLYMVLMSPIQRAALTSAVQRDIDWLRQQGCDRIAVVAHSQGGYVAYQALADPWSLPVEQFITFGSGLIRLFESEQARRKGWLVPALVGVIGALLAIRFSPDGVLGTFELTEKHQAGALAFAIGLLMTAGLIIAIRNYTRDRTPVPDLSVPIPWFDYITHEDPVLNGIPVGRLPTRVKKIEVQNRASVVADHGSYWQNGDQFVARVATKLGLLDPDLDLLKAGPMDSETAARHHLAGSWNRRHERVAALERVRTPVAIATAALLAIQFDDLESVGNMVAHAFAWFPSFVVSWLPDVIQSVVPIAVSHAAYLGAAVIIGLSLLGYRVGIGIWEAWGRADLVSQWAGRPPRQLSSGAIAFYGWTILHIAVIAIVAIVGPGTIIRGVGDAWAQRDPIVQAWARQYTWSLVAAGVILLAAGIKTRRVPERKLLSLVLRGTALAVLLEFVIALLFPGPMTANTSIPIGLAAEVLGLIVAEAITPVVSWAFLRLARRTQQFMKPSVVVGPVASLLDRFGVAGLLATLIAAVLTFQTIPLAMLFGALFALVGLSLALSMATNTAGRNLPYLGKIGPTPERLRMAGWVGAAAGLALFVVELGRLLVYLFTNGIPP
jgi:pimeloyl-ACP methyl ester carboxylesterase